MTVKLNTPAPDDTQERIADWLELRVLKLDRPAPFSDLFDAVTETLGNLDNDYENSLRDDLRSSLEEEINIREKALKDAYPFQYVGQSLSCKEQLTAGAWCYLLCLRLSLADSDLVVSGTVPIINDHERELFQLCSTIAAASIIHGESVSFGWPRPDRTSFLRALAGVFHNKIKEGKVRSTFLPGQSTHIKDGDVDIIAFAHANDCRPNQLCLFGQVASGLNWIDKPLGDGDIRAFTTHCFEECPQSPYIRAMFMPFCIQPPRHHGYSREEALRRCLSEHGARFGLLLTRHRVPHYVNLAVIAHTANPNGQIKPGEVSRLPELELWGRNFVRLMLA